MFPGASFHSAGEVTRAKTTNPKPPKGKAKGASVASATSGASSSPSASSARTTRSPEQTRARLIQAAKRVFAQRGLRGASVHDISAEAGVSTAMINHHFGGKEALYRACLESFGEARLRAVDAMLVPPTSREDFVTRLDVLVTHLLNLHLDDLDIVTILLRDQSESEQWGPKVEQRLFEFTIKLSHFFALAQERGLLRAGVDPLTPAAAIYLTLLGLIQYDPHRARVTGISIRDPAHRRDAVTRLLDLVLHGALAPSDSPEAPLKSTRG